jgi:CRP/FNR family cyclic AMP-dependent transcriptional regulator
VSDLSAALRYSCLGALSKPTLDLLLVDAHTVHYPAGTELPLAGEPVHPPGLIVEGLLRVFRREPDGREVTARYIDAGDLIGLSAVLAEDHRAVFEPRLRTEVLQDTDVLVFDPSPFRALLNDEPLGHALSRYVFGQLVASQDALTGSVLLPVRSRVARHLLDLAERRGGELVVRASPQRLAAAAGSVREVVWRVLREMEATGLLRRSGGQILLLDPGALHRVAAGEDDART